MLTEDGDGYVYDRYDDPEVYPEPCDRHCECVRCGGTPLIEFNGETVSASQALARCELVEFVQMCARGDARDWEPLEPTILRSAHAHTLERLPMQVGVGRGRHESKRIRVMRGMRFGRTWKRHRPTRHRPMVHTASHLR